MEYSDIIALGKLIVSDDYDFKGIDNDSFGSRLCRQKLHSLYCQMVEEQFPNTFSKLECMMDFDVYYNGVKWCKTGKNTELDEDEMFEMLCENLYCGSFAPSLSYIKNNKYWSSFSPDLVWWRDTSFCDFSKNLIGEENYGYKESDFLSLSDEKILKLFSTNEGTKDELRLKNNFVSCLSKHVSLEDNGVYSLIWTSLAEIMKEVCDEIHLYPFIAVSHLAPKFTQWSKGRKFTAKERALLQVYSSAKEHFKKQDAYFTSMNYARDDECTFFRTFVLGSYEDGYTNPSFDEVSTNPSLAVCARILDETVLWFDAKYHFL